MDETTNEPTEEMYPLAGSFLVRVNIRGKNVDVPTNADLAGMIQREVASSVRGDVVTVNVSAEHLD